MAGLVLLVRSLRRRSAGRFALDLLCLALRPRLGLRQYKGVLEYLSRYGIR